MKTTTQADPTIKAAANQAVGMVQEAAIKVWVVLAVAIVLIAIFKPKMRKIKQEMRERKRKEAMLSKDVKRAMKKK